MGTNALQILSSHYFGEHSRTPSGLWAGLDCLGISPTETEWCAQLAILLRFSSWAPKWSPPSPGLSCLPWSSPRRPTRRPAGSTCPGSASRSYKNHSFSVEHVSPESLKERKVFTSLCSSWTSRAAPAAPWTSWTCYRTRRTSSGSPLASATGSQGFHQSRRPEW